MMNPYSYVAFIPLLPLVVFLILGLFGRKYFKTSSGPIGVATILISTLLSLYAAYQYFFIDGKINGVFIKIIALKYTWLQFSPNVSIDMGILLDPISVMMIVIVSFISLMVHIFSLGYMKGEERLATYYAFLSLFTFSMLGLVVSSNIFQIYIFWELVGISSYLLIGILILSFHAETLDFHTLITRLTTSQSPQLISITTSSFLGASMLTWAL